MKKRVVVRRACQGGDCELDVFIYKEGSRPGREVRGSPSAFVTRAANHRALTIGVSADMIAAHLLHVCFVCHHKNFDNQVDSV